MSDDILNPIFQKQLENIIIEREIKLTVIKHYMKLLERVFGYYYQLPTYDIEYIDSNIDKFINPLMDSDTTLLFKSNIIKMKNSCIIDNNITLGIVYDYLKDSCSRLNYKME